MKKLVIVILMVTAFVMVAGLASAAGPTIGAFSTTGYSTHLIHIPDYPYLLPTEFQPVPSGHIKFHIASQGGAVVDNDALCRDLYGDLYFGATGLVLDSCQTLCLAFTGQACGTTDTFAGGSFTFDEWGLISDVMTGAGANYGNQIITTSTGEVDMRFGGLTDAIGVQGSFQVTDASGDYKGAKDEGTYAGNAGYVFTVNYTPCKDGDCPANRCAAFGEDMKLHKEDLKWKIDNEGEQAVTVSNILVNWPQDNGKITKIKLGGKEIFKGEAGLASVVPDVPGYYVVLADGDWKGKEHDRQIDKGKKEELKIEFDGKDISQNAWDYTIQVNFANGCAVPFVAFAPAP